MSDGKSQTGSPDDRQAGGGLARLFPVAVVTGIGIATTVFLFGLARDNEKRTAQENLQGLASVRKMFVQMKVASATEAVRGLAALYDASDEVNRDEFLIFAGSIASQHPEIRTLEWIQRVPDNQRPEAEAQLRGATVTNIGITELYDDGNIDTASSRSIYYPTLYFFETGGETGGKLLGFDNASHPEARRVLEQSATLNTIAASTWVSRQFKSLGDGEAVSVLVSLPVYAQEFRRGTLPETPEGRLAATRGWVMASLRIDRLLGEPRGDKLDQYLYSNTPPETGQVDLLKIDGYGLTLKTESTKAVENIAESGITKTIDVAGNTSWSLVMVPASSLGASLPGGQRGLAKWAVLAAGGGVTLLLGAYLFSVLGRTHEISHTVERRTAELRREIAEREKAERTLKNSEALYHSLVESAPMCIYRKDLKGRFVFGNSSYAETIGRSKAALAGLTDYDLFPKELADKYRVDDDRVISSGEFMEDVEEHKTPDGRSLYVHIIKAPVMDAFGNTVGSQGMFWDVTERHEAEERLRATAEELARSNADLEQFAYVASHDLQEPLRMVASYTQLLQRRYADQLDEEANEFIGFAVDGAVRMQHLIEDLLEYSRVETRGKPLVRVDADEALDDALANLKVALAETRATVTRDDLPAVMADQIQLTQVFQNLVANGTKFRRPGVNPEVHVGAKPVMDGSKSMIEFTVRDNGIGIQEDFFERIFVIFQRLHTREAFPGTGIGLALCKKIVERHGGRVWVKSTVGAGTTFFFTLRSAGTLAAGSSTAE